jgi:CMP-N,N'-diacetyllegionaminic acid synthase
MKKIVAVVPVRGGSQRVPQKNTRPFSGTTLLGLKLEVLTGVSGLDDIIVTTDSDECMTIARTFGVTVHERDSYFAGSQVTNDQHWQHIAKITPGDIVFMTQVTSPLVRRSTHEKALQKYLESFGQFDSLNSVTMEKKFLWRDGVALNYSADKTPKSQDLPEIVSLNFAITIINRDTMMRRCNVVGDHPQFLALDKVESIDIDDETDFKVAEVLFQKVGIDWLKG